MKGKPLGLSERTSSTSQDLAFQCGSKRKRIGFLVSQNTLAKIVLTLAVNTEICRKSNFVPCFCYLFYLMKFAFKKFDFVS